MIRPEALTRLRLLVGAVREPIVAGNLDRELPPLQPGQPIDGRVEQQTRSGFIVAVGGRTFEIKLPDGTRTGDLLRMVYVNGNPRPTFALLRVESATARPESRLSDAGKLLAMLQDAPGAAPDDAAADQTTPVFASRVPETVQAASLLRESLASSGLFYESHQAQWVLGMRTTAQLQREPQGKLVPLPSQPGDGVPASADPGQAVATEKAADFSVRVAAGGLETPREPASASRQTVAPETFPIVRQQLAALETGHVEWRGLVWPGQWMEWRVGEGPGDAIERDANSDGPEEVPRTWHTELRLELPRLGKVHARIDLDATGARLRILSDSDQQAQRLRAESPALALRFGANGIALHAIEVGQ